MDEIGGGSPRTAPGGKPADFIPTRQSHGPVRGGAPRRRGGRIAAITLLAVAAVSATAFYLGLNSGDDTPMVVRHDGPYKTRPDDPGGLSIPNQDKRVYDLIEDKDEDEENVHERAAEKQPSPTGMAAAPAPEPPAAESFAKSMAEPSPEPSPEPSTKPVAEPVTPPPPEKIPAAATRPRATGTKPMMPQSGVAQKTAKPPAVQKTAKPPAVQKTAEPVAEPVTPPPLEKMPAAATRPRAARAKPMMPQSGATQKTTKPSATEPKTVSLGKIEPPNLGKTLDPLLAALAGSGRRTVLKTAKAPKTETSGNWWVQIASLRSDGDALGEYKRQRRKLPILEGRKHRVVAVNLGAKGIYHRLQIGGFADGGAARSFCAHLKSAGSSCLVVKP